MKRNIATSSAEPPASCGVDCWSTARLLISQSIFWHLLTLAHDSCPVHESFRCPCKEVDGAICWARSARMLLSTYKGPLADFISFFGKVEWRRIASAELRAVLVHMRLAHHAMYYWQAK